MSKMVKILAAPINRGRDGVTMFLHSLRIYNQGKPSKGNGKVIDLKTKSENALSYSLPEECLVVDTKKVVCHNRCSDHNPHFAKTCTDLGNYHHQCPTYQRINGGIR